MNVTSDILTREQIQSIYESGPEEVIGLVKRLQSEIISLSERVSKLEARMSFDNFLLYLNRDREQAAERYNKLQQALISFFAWRGSVDPELRAEETLEILCRQVTKGREFDDLEKYSIGVARKVLLKEQERADWTQVSLDDLPYGYDLRLSSPPEQTLGEQKGNVYEECMKSCLRGLSDADRILITRYSGARGHDKENREKLAIEVGVSLRTLRVRVNRIRSELQKCLQKCLKGN